MEEGGGGGGGIEEGWEGGSCLPFEYEENNKPKIFQMQWSVATLYLGKSWLIAKMTISNQCLTLKMKVKVTE